MVHFGPTSKSFSLPEYYLAVSFILGVYEIKLKKNAWWFHVDNNTQPGVLARL